MKGRQSQRIRAKERCSYPRMPLPPCCEPIETERKESEATLETPAGAEDRKKKGRIDIGCQKARLSQKSVSRDIRSRK